MATHCHLSLSWFSALGPSLWKEIYNGSGKGWTEDGKRWNFVSVKNILKDVNNLEDYIS